MNGVGQAKEVLSNRSRVDHGRRTLATEVHMTPIAFMNQYRSMNVRFDDHQSRMVDVHLYLINKVASPHNAMVAKVLWAEISNRMDEQVR
jgi:hypothetical protein